MQANYYRKKWLLTLFYTAFMSLAGIVLGDVKGRENLITNPGFEEGNYGATNCPRGWVIGANDKEWEWSDTVAHNENGKSIKIGPINKNYKAISTDYMISVDPGKKYILTGWVKGDNSEKIMVACFWIPTFDEKGAFIENWQPPQELRVPVKAGTSWTQFRLPIVLKPEVRKIKVQLGFNENNSKGSFSVWFDDLELRELTDEEEVIIDGERHYIIKHEEHRGMPVPSEVSARRGYIVFSRVDGVYPNSIPEKDEITDILTAFATPGELVSMTFSMYPLEDLGKVKVRVNDLRDDHGHTIGKESVELRLVTCWLQKTSNVGSYEQMLIPECMIKKNEVEINQGRARQWWLTVRVPDDAAPGRYRGTINLSTAGKPAATIGICFRVLPFRLEKSDRAWGTYHGFAFGKWTAEGGDEKMMEWDFRALKSLGFDFILENEDTLACMVFRGKDGNLHLDFKRADKVVEIYQKVCFIEPFIVDTLRFPGAVMRLTGRHSLPTNAELNEAPVNYKEAYKSLMREIDRHARENHWPQIVYYPSDEPMEQNSLPLALENYRLLREALPDARIYCTVGNNLPEHPELAEYLNIACYAGEVLPGDLKLAEELDIELWEYTNATFEESFTLRRLKDGFMFVKKPVRRTCPWGHVLTPAHIDPEREDGCLEGKWKAYSLFYYKDGAMVPTLQSEGERAAIIDAKYAATLKAMISRARQGKNSATAKRAVEIEKTFQENLDAFPHNLVGMKFPYPAVSEADDKHNLLNDNAGRLRWKIAMDIVELQGLLNP